MTSSLCGLKTDLRKHIDEVYDHNAASQTAGTEDK